MLSWWDLTLPELTLLSDLPKSFTQQQADSKYPPNNQPKQPNQNQLTMLWQPSIALATPHVFYIKCKNRIVSYLQFLWCLFSFVKPSFLFAQHAPASVPAVLMASGGVWKRLSPPCIKDTSSSHVRETDLRGCILLFSLPLHCQLLLWCEREFIIGRLRRRDERREAGKREREGGEGVEEKVLT